MEPHQIIRYAIPGVGILFSGYKLVYGLTAGRITFRVRYRVREYTREDDPLAFWLLMALNGVAIGCWVYLMVAGFDLPGRSGQ